MARRLRAVGLEELWAGEMLGVELDGTAVLLVNIEGAVHAYRDRCAHLGVPLSEGRLQGSVLTCRAHCWQYDAATGAGINPRAVDLERLPTWVEADAVWVELPGGRGDD